ncbi:hypothetical protein [Xenorhabdus szentirmaii]|uniref:hypothetical protein n=1 Tax=Xenorhabdus szentirmaii TaxID=290112 RepID=UPI000C065BE9|nr:MULTISPECIES: hypothetical protein [Xenorhabdus]MBD2781297.1 hypothetical protein [Xenorhabdus sp. 38]PHM43072.1 hypothetical protein Xszus_02851 [Xenorhabdus szentirmaii]
MSRSSEKNRILLSILITTSIFSISLRIFSLSFIFSILTIIWYFLSKRVRVKDVSFFISIILFYILYIVIGLNNNIDKNYFLFKSLLFLVTSSFFYLLPFLVTDEKLNNYLKFYALLSIGYVYIIALYSYMNGFRGYNDLYDPFIKMPINSPLISLLAVIAYIVLCETIQKSTGNMIFLFILLTINILCCFIYLGSRASFIIMIIYISFKYLLYFKGLSTNKKIISIIISSSILIFFMNEVNLLKLGGFEKRGLESSRFDILKNGLNMMWDYPFGGLKVVSKYYDGLWFHNMFLDIVRVSGYIVLLYWCFILFITSIIIVLNKKNNKKTFGLLFIILIISFSQDLAFDGHYNTIGLLFMIMGINMKKIRMIK